MFTCDDLQFIFISATKSGSSSVYKVLGENFSGVRYKRTHKIIPKEFKNYTSFCVVRNPYSRLISWWWSICKAPTDRYGHWKELEQMGLTKSLEDFLTLWATKNGITQSKIVEVNDKIDYTVKLENLEEEFNQLPFVTNHITFPHKNKKNHPHWRELITPEAGEIINKTFKKDFEIFGYDMENFK